MDQLMCEVSGDKCDNARVAALVGEQKLSCKISVLASPNDNSTIKKNHSFTKLVRNKDDLNNLYKVQRNIDNYIEEEKEVAEEYVGLSLHQQGHRFDDVLHWDKIEQPEKADMFRLLRFMIEYHIKTNVQIEVNKMFFSCNFPVLQVYSGFFMEIENPYIIRLPVQKVTEKAFLAIYKWMLGNTPTINRSDIVEVFIAATYLRIHDLLNQCWFYFDNVRNFNEDTACVFYVECLRYPAMSVVRNLMLTRVSKFFLTFVASREFLNLPLKHLTFLIKSNTICVNSEMEVLFTVIRWLSHRWDERRSYCLKMLKCIRFHLMPIWYLLTLSKSDENTIIKYIVELPEIQEILQNAINDVTTIMFNGLWSTECNDANFDRVMTLNCIDQRLWVQDKTCPYHHLIGCPNLRYLTYKDFVLYLRQLQLQPPNYWSVQFNEISSRKDEKCCEYIHDGSPGTRMLEDLETESE